MQPQKELYANRNLSDVLNLMCRMAGFRVVEESYVPRTLLDYSAAQEAKFAGGAATCCATKDGKSYVFSIRLSSGVYENSLRVVAIAESKPDQEAASAAMQEALRRLGEIALRVV